MAVICGGSLEHTSSFEFDHGSRSGDTTPSFASVAIDVLMISRCEHQHFVSSCLLPPPILS